MDNATRRQLLDRAKQIGYPGDILSVFQNPQLLDQFEQQVQQSQQQQQQPQLPQQIQQQFSQQVELPTPPATTPNYRIPQVPQSEAKPLIMSFNQTPPQLMKNGGPKEMPFGLPLKEQNIYLVPDYNQPKNLMTGEILPDPQRPNLGMDTGATEYKYTYGTDKGDINVPSIVSGQYIGDQAFDRYMLTGERFKTMNDPSSYSKFYDQIGQLGLMQEKKFDKGGPKDPPKKSSTPPPVPMPSITEPVISTNVILPVPQFDNLSLNNINEEFTQQPIKEYFPSDSYIQELRKQENAGKTGYKNDRFYPYPSVEGGTPTIAYGHKLTKNEDAKGVYNKGLTEEEATKLMMNDLTKHVSVAKDSFNAKYGEGKFDSLPPELKDLVVDYSYTGTGIAKFPNFHNAIYAYATATNPDEKLKAQEKMLAQYKRHTGGKELTNRNAFTKTILTGLNVKKYGGLKFENGGPKEKGWKEYKTPTGESLYLDPRFKDQRYYVNEKGDHVTPNQNMSLYNVTDNVWESGASMNTLNISAKEATPFLASIPEDVKMQSFNQGEIKPAPSEFDSNVAKAYYIASNPMSALGHYAKYGYVPQGNIGNYGLRHDQSPMEMVVNSVNPASWLNAGYRFATDLTKANTYTTKEGAVNAGLDALEALPMFGVIKSGLPSVVEDVNLGKQLIKNNVNRGIGYLESKEGVFGRSPKLQYIPKENTLNATQISKHADIEKGMALQSFEKDPVEKLKKTIEYIESKPNLSNDEIYNMFGKSKETLYKEFDDFVINPKNVEPPNTTESINLQRPRRSIGIDISDEPTGTAPVNAISEYEMNLANSRIAARAQARATRAAMDNIRRNISVGQIEQNIEELPAYLRRSINLDNSVEGLPVINFDPNTSAIDFESIRNHMNALTVKPTITRAKDAIKGLFNSNPQYKGKFERFMPSFDASMYPNQREMLLDVKSKLNEGLQNLKIGEVGTGSTNTSHNSYLNQMDFIAQNAGTQGLSKPIFLGYTPMNQSGYLSTAKVSSDDIFKHINTKLNQIQTKRNFNFGLGENAPFMNEAGHIMLPQYGVKKINNSFTGIKKELGGKKCYTCKDSKLKVLYNKSKI